MGDLALLVVYGTPHLLAVWAARLRPPDRAAIWLGAAALSLLEALPLMLGGLGFLLLPAPLLLWLGAQGELRDGEERRPRTWLAVLIVLAGLAAWGTLWVRHDPRCWKEVIGPEGYQWIEAPVIGGTGHASQRLGPGERRGVCASDIITPLEGITSMGIWTATTALIARHRQD